MIVVEMLPIVAEKLVVVVEMLPNVAEKLVSVQEIEPTVTEHLVVVVDKLSMEPEVVEVLSFVAGMLVYLM